MTNTQPHSAAASSRLSAEEVILSLPKSLSGQTLFDDLPRGLHVGDGDVSFGPERGQRDELTIHGPAGFINVCAQGGNHWVELVAPARHDLGLHEPRAVRVDLGAAADRLGVPVVDLAPLLERAGTALVQARAELDGDFRPNRPIQQETTMTEQHIDADGADRDKRIGDSIAAENAAEVFNDWNIRKASGQRVVVGARSFDKGASWVNLASREHPEFKVTVGLAGKDEFTVRAVTTREGDTDLLGTGEDVDQWMMLPEGVGERTVRQAVTELRNGEIGMVAGTPDADPHARVQHAPDQTSWRPANPAPELLGTRAAYEALVAQDEQGEEKRAVAGDGWSAVDVSMLMDAWGVDEQTARDGFVRGLVEPGGEQHVVNNEVENAKQGPDYYDLVGGEMVGVNAGQEQDKIDSQDRAASTFNPEKMDAVADGRRVAMEPYYGGALENSDVVVTAAATGRGDVSVRVDADRQVHTDTHLAGRTVLDANPTQVAAALDVDVDAAHQSVMAAAHQLERGQVAYDAVGDLDAVVETFDREQGETATESLQWGSGPASQFELPDAIQQFPSDLAEARAISRRHPARRPDVQPASAPVARDRSHPRSDGVIAMETQELVDQVEASLAQAQHFLGIADYDSQSATAGAQRRALEGTPLPGMVAAHRDAAAEAYDALQRGSEHVNHAYAGVIALTKAPHLTDENHDWVVGTLASVVEAMVAASKATPHLEAGTTHLFAATNPAADPRRVSSQLVKARDELSLAIPQVSTAARVVDQTAARRSPDGQVGPAQPLARAQARQQMAVPTPAGTQPAGPRR